MRGLVVVISLALLAGPAAGQGKVVEIIPGSGDDRIMVPHSDMERYITGALPRARDLLDRELIDYPSARFRSVVAHGAPYTLSAGYCGLVNSRNRAGGFAGWEPFALLIAADTEALYVGTDGSAPIMIEALCAASGRRTVQGDFSDRLTHR